MTATDLIKVLNEAKKLGAISIKIPGFEVCFSGEKGGALTIPGSELCKKCGSDDMRPSEYFDGNYCHTCHLNRKESNFQRGQR